MGGVSTEQGSNNLDVELNLVPFIDLLSTLVLFLLLTVVWVQVAAIPASVDSKGKSTVSIPNNTKLMITLKPGRVELVWPANLSGKAYPRTVQKLEQIGPILQNLVKRGTLIPASVGGDNLVEYGHVINALDFLKDTGLTNVALSTE